MKIACVQINSGSDMTANIGKLELLVASAAERAAELVALPENAFLMEEPGQRDRRTVYSEQEHPGLQAAQQWAKMRGIWILVGSAAIVEDASPKTYNRSILINPQGQIAARYDKIHLFDVTLPGGETYAESAKMLAGAKTMLADVKGLKLGMTICYDVRFPQLYRALAKAGADILAVPAAFTQTTGEAHWDILLRARAIENGCYVIAPAQTGTHPGNRKTYGHALIVDPWGRVLADAGITEGVILANIDPELVKRTRAKLPSLQHDRDFQ